MRLCLDAARAAPRVLAQPEPACLLTGFGDSSVELELCFWIDDPQAGTTNVRSAVLLGVWDRFHEHGIEIPFPQRDLHIRTPAELRLVTTPAPADGRSRARVAATADP